MSVLSDLRRILSSDTSKDLEVGKVLGLTGSVMYVQIDSKVTTLPRDPSASLGDTVAMQGGHIVGFMSGKKDYGTMQM